MSDKNRSPQIVDLVEYEPARLPGAALSEEDGRRLDTRYRPQLQVTPPSYQTDHNWLMTPQGWVGYIPLNERLILHLKPKLPVANLFRMLAYAYDLTDFLFLDGLVHCRSLDEFYCFLVQELTDRIDRRLRQGLFRAYVPHRERRPAVVGVLDLAEIARRPDLPAPPCIFEAHTADVPHNQILAWGLRTAALSGLCGGSLQQRVQRAYRRLPVTLRPFAAEDCTALAYDRLNEDYRPMHLLCRFILALTGPGEERGPDRQLPFLVNMNQLFEQFVAAWLSRRLPPGFELRRQERVQLDSVDRRSIQIDLVLMSPTGRPICVLDTKYKAPERADLRDVYQVTFYAHAQGCGEAFLVYPTPLHRPLDGRNRDVRYRSVIFALDGDLEQAGAAFVDQLNPLLGLSGAGKNG